MPWKFLMAVGGNGSSVAFVVTGPEVSVSIRSRGRTRLRPHEWGGGNSPDDATGV
jgi:hypothetical protein